MTELTEFEKKVYDKAMEIVRDAAMKDRRFLDKCYPKTDDKKLRALHHRYQESVGIIRNIFYNEYFTEDEKRDST